MVISALSITLAANQLCIGSLPLEKWLQTNWRIIVSGFLPSPHPLLHLVFGKDGGMTLKLLISENCESRPGVAFQWASLEVWLDPYALSSPLWGLRKLLTRGAWGLGREWVTAELTTNATLPLPAVGRGQVPSC